MYGSAEELHGAAVRHDCGTGCTHGESSLVSAVNLGLDRTVARAHKLLPGRYHPYFLTEDVACLAIIAAGFAFQAAFGALNGAIHALAIGVTFFLYVAVYLKLKRRVTGIGARSVMQDSLIFVIPVYLGLSWALGQDMRAATDMLAFSLLLAVACMRIGCFVGGCCHGKPSRVGVLYGRAVLRDIDGARLYASGPYLGVRVFPLQLVASACLFAIFAALWLRLSGLPRPDGSTLPIAVVAYASLRFTLEFFRGHRHRPKHFGLSEAQWLSFGILGIAAAVTFVI